MTENSDIEYSEIQMFAAPTRTGTPASVFGSPCRYVQGDGVIDAAGHYTQRLGLKEALVLASQRSLGAEGGRVVSSLRHAGIGATAAVFGGECSLQEIDRQVAGARAQANEPDVVVAVGGGKCVDAGRAIADRLGIETIVVPSLASNDAPTAAVSVIYTEDGVTLDAEIYPRNPVLVLVDTGVVASADARYLAAGMADAMATWYEARATAANAEGVNVFGGRPTLVGTAVARLCRDTLFTHGRDAQDAVREQRVTPALEAVVEANTLMSGLGYESGGLAVAHALAQGFTVLESVHCSRLHGEMVALGTLAQLVLEGDREEGEQVARFFADVGLPVTLAGLGVDSRDDASLAAVVDGAIAFPFLANMPEPVEAVALRRALLGADKLGKQVLEENGA